MNLMPVRDCKDYDEILKGLDVAYGEVGPFLYVGSTATKYGWVLHVSVIWSELSELLVQLIPELVSINVAFRIAKNREVASMILDGLLGDAILAKVVSVYPRDDNEAFFLAKRLVYITSRFRGPEISGCVSLGGLVYVRYGLINSGLFYMDLPDESVDQINVDWKYENWPFEDLVPSAGSNIASDGLLNNAYKGVFVLKDDAKGKVIKALRLKGVRMEWCIVKEGKHDMGADIDGRDMTDRLLWQYKLHQELSDKLPLPLVYDFFYQRRNAYLVIKWVEGAVLQDSINRIYGIDCWLSLGVKKKAELLDILLKLIGVIESFHLAGYVHRDITPKNFILDKKGNLIMIDVELAYSLDKSTPSPPFTFGTNGFMSPEQFAVAVPTIKEDIYGLGGVMIFFFTRLYPFRLRKEYANQLKSTLLFFIESEELVDVIVQCLRSDPSKRPDLLVVKSIVQKFRNEVYAKRDHKFLIEHEVLRGAVSQILDRSVLALGADIMVGSDKIWHSDLISNAYLGNVYSTGLYSGIGGVMYFVAVVKKAGFDVNNLMEIYKNGLSYFKDYCSTLNVNRTGLYDGSAGVAVAVKIGMENGLLELTQENIALIRKCFSYQSNGVGIADGVAGQGLAALLCSSYLDDHILNLFVTEIISDFLNKKGFGGDSRFNGLEGFKRLDFANGIAGRIFFLLKCIKSGRSSSEISRSVDRMLRQLWRGVSRELNGGWMGFISKRKSLISPWLDDGLAGIALCFIIAYDIFKVPFYKRIALTILRKIPLYLVGDDLGLNHGLAGVGEVYLDAFRVFGDVELQERADWIASLLLHTCQSESDGISYWSVQDGRAPTASLMIGNGGIIHFLLRHSMPKDIGFPLLND